MKLDPASLFVTALISSGVRVAAGVPDSLLGALSAELDSNTNIEHIKAPNEGLALSAALGYQIASNQKSVVYLQNSGLGNLVNPYLSLFHAGVYDVPAFLIVGWRGQFPDSDEPQHRVQGAKTEAMLNLLDIQTVYLKDTSGIQTSVDEAMNLSRQGRSIAILVAKGALGHPPSTGGSGSKPERKTWLKCIKDSVDTSTFIISTTGKTSRELYELQSVNERKRTFYCVGGMGHASSIAAGMAKAKPNSKFVCIDGDGAFQMHAGSVALIGSVQPQNLLHVMISNGVHESVGGQEITSETYDYMGIAKSTGYTNVYTVSRVEELSNLIPSLLKTVGPHFILCETSSAASGELGRPLGTPREWINDFNGSINSHGT